MEEYFNSYCKKCNKKEILLTLFLNDKELVKLRCLLGSGYYLASKGIIKTMGEVHKIEIDSQAGIVHAEVT